jgi:diguanylate cyclase (GGDEF)-like protein
MLLNLIKRAQKNRLYILVDFIMVFLVALFLILYTIYNNHSYLQISDAQTEHISQLVAEMLNTELNTSLNKPKAIALSMSDNVMVRNLLEEEAANMDSAEYTQRIANYLDGIKKEFALSSSFLVSDFSKRYYYPGGIDRYMDDTGKNSWYYSLLDSRKDSEWNVDYDIVGTRKTYTLFVNAKVKDQNGKTLGVVGTGMKMSNIDNTLNELASQYDLTCVLLDKDANVLASSDPSLTSPAHLAGLLGIGRKKLLGDIGSGTGRWIKGRYLYTAHINSTGWHVVIVRSSQGFSRMLFHNTDTALLLASSAAVILILFLFIAFLIRGYTREFRKIAEYDHLTRIPNRKYLERKVPAYLPACDEKEMFLFLFDIDHFKEINDTRGHKAGDSVLERTAAIADAIVKNHGLTVRWGGDEFCGLVVESDPQAVFCKIQSALKQMLDGITISVGYTRVRKGDTLEDLMRRADDALYDAKETGRDRSCCCEKMNQR